VNSCDGNIARQGNFPLTESIAGPSQDRPSLLCEGQTETKPGAFSKPLDVVSAPAIVEEAIVKTFSQIRLVV